MFPVFFFILVLFMTMVLAMVSRWLPISSIKKAIKIVHTTTNHVVAQPIRERVSHTCMHTMREIERQRDREERKKERRMYVWLGIALPVHGMVEFHLAVNCTPA